MSYTPSHLLDESPLVVYKSLALAMGINKAHIFQQLHFLLNGQKTAKNDYVLVDDRWWVYNSYEEWQEHFPWLSVSAIKGFFRSLEADGLVISRQGVKRASDRKKWYTIDYAAWDAFKLTIGQKEAPKPLDKKKPVHGTKNVRWTGQKMSDDSSDTTAQESNTDLVSEYESSSSIDARAGDDDDIHRDGESESVVLKEEIRAGLTDNKTYSLPDLLKTYGAARMNRAHTVAVERNAANPIGYMISLLTSNSPLTPVSAAPLPPASVAQSAYADWIDVGFGPGIFAPPEQPVTQGDTADDNTPALDDEQREYFRQVDAEDETTPDAEFTDMSDVIPVEIQALQK